MPERVFILLVDAMSNFGIGDRQLEPRRGLRGGREAERHHRAASAFSDGVLGLYIALATLDDAFGRVRQGGMNDQTYDYARPELRAPLKRAHRGAIAMIKAIGISQMIDKPRSLDQRLSS